MGEITLGQAWIDLFNVVGAVKLVYIIGCINLIMGFLFMYFETGFWRWFGWFSFIVGIINLLGIVIE